jgi:hypothetical protein
MLCMFTLFKYSGNYEYMYQLKCLQKTLQICLKKCVCSRMILEREIISLYLVIQLFVLETQCVSCEVLILLLNII